MKVKFDFKLNSRSFGIVEQTIMRLVLNGYTSVPTVSALLWVFSDEVKARAIQNLVNAQILHVSLDTKELSLSKGTQALITGCGNNTYELDIPDTLLTQMEDDRLIIDDYQVISSILYQVAPEVNLNHLVKYICFSITIVR